ncbi:MAG: RNA-binding transcriptional accessory protein [Planctomycetes bacterium]|nr:RNA-binding transcriptional accessory protein [Planctomycetota bacterium]
MDQHTTTRVDLARVAAELRLRLEQVTQTVQLLDEGNTVPFITRYRKERTGNLNEEQIRAIEERVQSLRQLAERAADILRLIDGQGKLTPELRTEIERANSLKRLEDLYLPFRPKRRSRATIARERGLEPLAESIWNQTLNDAGLKAAAEPLIRPDLELPDAESVLAGAADILAERISDDADLRERCRNIARLTGKLTSVGSKVADQTHPEFRDYFDYSEPISKMPPHRILALNRGEEQKALRVSFDWDGPQALWNAIEHLRIKDHACREFLTACATDALERFIRPALEREARRDLTEKAERHAITVFSQNLRQLLLQPPLRDQRVLAIDPGFRTGCKLAALDEFGSLLGIDIVSIVGSSDRKTEARSKLAAFLREHRCLVIAIGNGTACRETEELVSELIATECPEARYIIVNEAGASIYSTSTVAQQEFANLDATARGTVSIGRRLQDPLSELVKIEPQHIGVGMYQHDLNAKQLKEALDDVVESCVNFVGVDLNTASPSLLMHVSGFNQLIARRVVEYREKTGRFQSRKQLLDVPGVGPATFTQAAGFLKLEGDEPLDNTWIHPESYEVARLLLARCNVTPDLLRPGADRTPLREQLSTVEPPQLSKELAVGLPTLTDIIDALLRPGRDPRADLPPPLFRKGVLSLDHIEVGMELQGTILNVVDFGAFVDVGLKDSALVHISQLATHFVRSPLDVVAIGDVVTVWVLSVDRERKRVGLTMIPPDGAVSSPKAIRESKLATAKPVAARPDGKGTTDTGDSAPPADGPLRGFDELKQAWQNRPR